MSNTQKTPMPEKGQRVRVSGTTLEGWTFPPFEGIVSGIEFRVDPPVLFVISDGKTRQIVNLGHGSRWEPAS